MNQDLLILNRDLKMELLKDLKMELLKLYEGNIEFAQQGLDFVMSDELETRVALTPPTPE